MTISSAQQNCSITSSSSADTITIDLSSLSSDTITLTGAVGAGSYNYYPTGSSTNVVIGGGYTVSGLSSASIGTISINDVISDFQIQEEWVNSFPSFDRIQDMCKQYPGLRIAYEKFVTTYKLVKDDYDTPEDQRPKP